MNSVILIGRLARDPELRYTPNSQTAIAHITLAVDRPVQQGRERQADFIRVTVFGRQAETVERYLKKGRQVAVSGRIQTGSYQNRDGQTVYTTDVVADRVEFLGSGQDRAQGGYGDQSYGNQSYNGGQGGYSGQSSRGGYNNSGNQSFGDSGFGASDDPFGNMDIPDSFQAAEDDIPF